MYRSVYSNSNAQIITILQICKRILLAGKVSPVCLCFQLFVNATTQEVSLNVRDVTEVGNSQGLTLTGVIEDKDRQPSSSPPTTQFQPVLSPSRRYRLSWLGGTAPSMVDMSMYQFNL